MGLVGIYIQSCVTYLQKVFLGSPGVQTWPTLVIIWFIRITTLSILLRTYIGPWLLARLSSRIRVRSVSLWSIRGLYFRTGSQTWRIERISYVWSYVNGSRRIAVKINGLNVDIAKVKVQDKSPMRRHNRNLTLADFDPSPLARWIWQFLYGIAVKLEPFLRPLIRTYVVACLRLLIQWLPTITQAVSFDLHSSVLTMSEVPGTQVAIKEISLHTTLDFTQLEKVLDSVELESIPRRSEPRGFYGIGALKRRLTDSFQRSLDRAWGKTQGTASILFKLSHVEGTMQPDLDRITSFLSFPGHIDFAASVRFNPRAGMLTSQTLEATLDIGECSVKVDLLNKLLKSFRSQTTKTPSHITLPIQLDSIIFPGSPSRLPVLHSPISFGASSNYFRTPSSISSDASLVHSHIHEEPSHVASPIPPISPTSPFIRAITASSYTASMRPRHRYFIQPSSKLRSCRNQSLLSVLRSVNVSISTIHLNISRGHSAEPHRITFKDVSLAFRMSDPSLDPLHRHWLGRSQKTENFDSSAYIVKAASSQITLERVKTFNNERILEIGVMDLQVLVSQWPSPWLMVSPFLIGDPNAPLFAMKVAIDRVQVTERLEHLHLLFDPQYTFPMQTKESVQPLSSIHLPRIAVNLQCGPICSRIVIPSEATSGPLALELRTKGFIVSTTSYFSSLPSHQGSSSNKEFPLLMLASFDAVLQPTLVRVRSKWMADGPGKDVTISDPEFLEDPAVLSLEFLEISGKISGLANIDGEPAALVDTASLTYDFNASVDAFCIELWHRDVIEAVLLLSFLSKHSTPTATKSASFSLDILPPGLALRFAVARFVIFITAPDVNPNDTLELSRGLALRTAFSIEYSFLKAHHAQLDDLRLNQKRLKLSLTAPLSAAASAAAKISQSACPFAQIWASNTSLRSAVATQYEPDDPSIAGRDDLSHSYQEFLQIGTILANICLKRDDISEPSQRSTQVYNIDLNIPFIRVNFQLNHVYSILLALQTMRKYTSSPRNHVQKASKIMLNFNGAVSTVQILCKMPQQLLLIRIDELGLRYTTSLSKAIRVRRTVVWAPVPPQINRWEESKPKPWEEIFKLSKWELTSLDLDSLSISVAGDGARLRIPCGFIMADLINDIIVTIKALRHLNHIAVAGVYSEFPPPIVEEAKTVPNLTLQVGYLSLEVTDDPFESSLSVIWRIGAEAARHRMDREDAFLAKVAAILANEAEVDPVIMVPESDTDYQFSAKSSVSLEEARQRLDDVHVLDWTLRLERERERRLREEEAIEHKLLGPSEMPSSPIPNLVPVSNLDQNPPLFRAMLNNVCLSITPPSFPITRLPHFMHEQGSGLPLDTQFSLLIPMHINFTLSSLKMSLRDYPLPLVSILPNKDIGKPAWTFDTDFVIGEEMGTELSVDWVRCPVIEGTDGAVPLLLSIPRTIMPVKTYAKPSIQIASASPSFFSWGVSYGPAIQDLMRIIDTISSTPRDSSPAMGFWDKMRLIFHWNVCASFENEVRYYIKGSRDPHDTVDEGTGFGLCWQGKPELRIGYNNSQRELIQVTSNIMLIAIPNLENVHTLSSECQVLDFGGPFLKVCARFGSGIRFGIGFVFERSCGLECSSCTGPSFRRHCRFFDFKPHYQVQLERKLTVPVRQGYGDSFNEFRSDFIHLSVSLASSLQASKAKHLQNASNLYLTPRAFTHFWSWWSLFDSTLTLPIRQGDYYSYRALSPKFGRHIATIKYQLSVPRLFIMHGYIDDSRETWADGVTPWIGVKGMIDEFQADMHQREEEMVVPGPFADTPKVVRRKAFYAAEVVLKGVDLRAILATFEEPLKRDVHMTAPQQRSNYRKHTELPITTPSSSWYDLGDFHEIGWQIPSNPLIHVLPVATCPRFTYFKRNTAVLSNANQNSKFGTEGTHRCMLGKEPSVPQIQVMLATLRIKELRQVSRNRNDGKLEKAVNLLDDYIAMLRETDSLTERPQSEASQPYHMPYDILSSNEWAEFDNVYQIHSPSVFMGSAIRDIMMQYYYCSRARRGLEYHMATRAVKFIRDQADEALASVNLEEDLNQDKTRGSSNTAQIAASALRKILKGDNPKTSVDVSIDKEIVVDAIDPLRGWSDGVSLRKSHCCLLLKPQIVFHGEDSQDICIVAAAQAKLQSYNIMDITNVDDPISGKVMSRSYMSLLGLQTFSPVQALSSGDGRVPLEVLIDLRCESDAFERLVPQTDATFHYDKFNRLRLRNNITSVKTRVSIDKSPTFGDHHLQDQTDLIRVHVPRFTVSASDEHFQTISKIVTKLLLFSDAAHKTRLERLETLLFTYDFTDLQSAANVVSNLQCRLRDTMETERNMTRHLHLLQDDEDKLKILELQGHTFRLAEKLNFLFDAIKLAQDRLDDRSDQKSALLLHTSSSEISWRMLDETKNLLAKLVVRDIDFYWLSRQDSSIVNNLMVGDLTAYDGSRFAIWAEILAKHKETANHPLSKKGLFLLANWTILPSVGGIAIYESLLLSLHPLRLQIDAKVGQRIMEYVWPARKQRGYDIEDTERPATPHTPTHIQTKSPTSRTSLDSPRALLSIRHAHEDSLSPQLRKLSSSRSFTDLRTSRATPSLQRTHSSSSMHALAKPSPDSEVLQRDQDVSEESQEKHKIGDAAVMKTRSSQKTFVLVRISSLNLLLSVIKEGSFECRDARIQTRDLEYRNQTRSFEELVNQFIPSNLSWRGWVKMAFHQPLIPILPVAKELFSKTKWIAPSKSGTQPHEDPLSHPHPRQLIRDDDSRPLFTQAGSSITRRGTKNKSLAPLLTSQLQITSLAPIEPDIPSSSGRSGNRKKGINLLFSKSHSRSAGDNSSSAKLSEDD